jgi:hypothetical protein
MSSRTIQASNSFRMGTPFRVQRAGVYALTAAREAAACRVSLADTTGIDGA